MSSKWRKRKHKVKKYFWTALVFLLPAVTILIFAYLLASLAQD